MEQHAQFKVLHQTHRMQPQLNDFTGLLNKKEAQLNDMDRDQLDRYKNRGVPSTLDFRSLKDIISSGQLKESLTSKLVPRARASPMGSIRHTTPMSKVSRNTLE